LVVDIVYRTPETMCGDQTRRIALPADLPCRKDVRDPVDTIAESAYLHNDLAVEAVRARGPDAGHRRRAHAVEERIGNVLQIVGCHRERVRERLRLSPWVPRLQRVPSKLVVDAVCLFCFREEVANLRWR
jgi:hypothetical protein